MLSRLSSFRIPLNGIKSSGVWRLASVASMSDSPSTNTNNSIASVAQTPAEPVTPKDLAAVSKTSAVLAGLGFGALSSAWMEASSSTAVTFAASGAEASVFSSLPTVTGPLATFLAVAPPACFGFLQMSGLKTCKEIKERGAVGDIPPLPFVSLATNCVVWVTYGALKWDMTVLLPNFTGMLFGMYYTWVYMKYQNINSYLAGAGAITAATVGMALTLPAADAAHYIGLTGVTLATVLMSSPLATMKTVIETKNTSSMPFVTSVAVLGNAVAWSSYGLFVAHDPFIFGPNLLGFGSAVVQMGLFAKYGIHSEAPAAVEDSEKPADSN